MDVLFACTKNTRPLLPDSLRLWRSDAPLSVSAEERQHLLALGLQTLVDLRSEEEQARRPCPLRNDPAFVYHSLPVTGGNAVPASPEEVAASYLRMLDERMEEILACILGAKTGVLYFCSAGKDRTGVVSALLLERLGYERAYILDDYLRSGAALREVLDAFCAAHPEIDPEVVRPQRRYMEEFLDRHRASNAQKNLKKP